MVEERPTLKDQAAGHSIPFGEQPSGSIDSEPKHESSLLQDVLDFTKTHPASTAFGIMALGVAGGGALRLAFGARAALAASETIPVVHLTSRQAAESILASQRIGGQWGIFAVDASQVPKTALGRLANTLVPRELSSGVRLEGEAAAAFRPPTPVGPFSLARNIFGVRSTPLGSIDLAANRFVPNQIMRNGMFRQATGGEIARYKYHQWLLDYGIDAEIYATAAFFAAGDDNKDNR